MAAKKTTSRHVSDAEAYVSAVVSGKIPVCRWVKLACERHLRDLKSSKSAAFPFRFDPTKAHRACSFFEKLPHTKGKWARKDPATGEFRTIRLERWQKFIIASIFGWVRKTNGTRRFQKARLYVPRKNGKSIFGAGIGLYMLTMDNEPGAEVYSGATSEKQAWEVFGPARQMCLIDPEICEAFGVTVNAQSLICIADNSRFLPVIGKPGDGSSPHCAIIDEYHEHKTSELIDTMETGMGAREQPLSLVISTAGADISGPCREDWLGCERILENHPGFEDDTCFCIIYTIDPTDDWDTEAALIKANPNWGVSINAERILADLATARQSARKQTAFKTKYLNVWCSARDGFFNVADWAALGNPALRREDFAEFPSYLGGDLATKFDLVSMVQLFCLPGDRYAVFCRHYLPEETLELPENQHYRNWHLSGHLQIAGESVTDFETFKEDAMELARTYRVEEFPFDPYRAYGVFSDLEREGLPVVEYRNTTLTMSEPMKQLDALIRSGRILHDGDPILAWAIANTTAKVDAKENVFPRKENPANKIDPVVSLLMALGRAMKRDTSTADAPATLW